MYFVILVFQFSELFIVICKPWFRLEADLLFFQQQKKSRQKNAASYRSPSEKRRGFLRHSRAVRPLRNSLTKNFRSDILAESLRTAHSLLCELKRCRGQKQKKLNPKPNLIFARLYQLMLLTLTPLKEPRSERFVRGFPRGLFEGIAF